MLATIPDVESRLGRALDADEVARVDGLLGEASALVEAHTGRTFDPVPETVSIVASRMVARVLQMPDDGFNSESETLTAGPFSKNVKYVAGASGGSPWLTAVDRKMLRPFGRRRGGVFSVEFG